ncbi:hypothetical protein [Paraflavitalea pollutisoli]|uniref:hypothetical protein n=1 Tax=Paraflavitalea pollutisoli TaxID=3034143 RepID=UPI0023EABBA4|nr:hypothetical protein [Paraflavitalea sp. H1-2-19X]
MKAHPVIKPLVALAMLLLFTLSITPRQYLHDLFADHRDIAVHTHDTDEDQLDTAGFSCNTHDQVAESPFTGHPAQPRITPPLLFPTATTQHFLTHLRLQAPSVVDGRGPPALV